MPAWLTLVFGFLKSLFDALGIVDGWVTKTPQEKEEDIRKDDRAENEKMQETGRPPKWD